MIVHRVVWHKLAMQLHLTSFDRADRRSGLKLFPELPVVNVCYTCECETVLCCNKCNMHPQQNLGETSSLKVLPLTVVLKQ